jgi:hypothetical protein
MEEQALREAVEQFGPCPARIHRGYVVPGRVDLAVATAWWTAEVAEREVEAAQALGAVQETTIDIEPPGGTEIPATAS